jgi:predicted site-specific integrase-resolvase
VPSPMLSRAHVAEILDVSERTVRRWGAGGLLDERRIGPHTVRVTAESVEALIAEADGQQNRGREDVAA